MINLFGSLKTVTKVESVCIDNNVFRLHYKVTVLFLFACSLLVTSRQYFGDPIDCIQNDDIPKQVIDTYCWIHSTFTLPEAFNKKVGVEVPHPGVDKYNPGQPRVYQKYYQWVCFVLFLQGVLFYFPRYMWKLWEGGRVRSLVLELDNPVLNKGRRDEQVDLLVFYLKLNHLKHNSYFYYFVMCEFLNLLNVFVQIYLVNSFLGGVFTSYGFDVLKYTEMDQEYRIDPMIKRFPRMAKCTFHRFGSSGDVQRHDALCILPLNIINEKIYIFLWFWFFFLSIVTSIILVYRIFEIFFPTIRYKRLCKLANLADKSTLREILNKVGPGDWFILSQIGKNIDPINFKIVLERFKVNIQDLSDDSELKPLKPHEDKL